MGRERRIRGDSQVPDSSEDWAGVAIAEAGKRVRWGKDRFMGVK